MTKKAVILLSGGLDSATSGAIAKEQGFELYALTVAYGQLHDAELAAAKRVAAWLGVTDHKVITIDLRVFGGSALTDSSMSVPKDRSIDTIVSEGEPPPTYVPARNTIFLSYAFAWCEVLKATDIFLGVNVLDASGYPDCKAEFVQAFESLANIGGSQVGYQIHAPLVKMTKAEIVKEGTRLGLDYGITHSCYDPVGDGACGHCDACLLRKKGFADANLADPTRYAG